jgi:hypothetical protein
MLRQGWFLACLENLELDRDVFRDSTEVYQGPPGSVFRVRPRLYL